jgi:hypothetical protein
MRQKGGEPYSKGVEPAGERSEYRPRQSLGVCGSNAGAQAPRADRKLMSGRDFASHESLKTWTALGRLQRFR